MEKTRFSEFTASEINLMIASFLVAKEKTKKDINLMDLLAELVRQKNINDWNKKEFEIKKRIEELEKELNDLKKLINN